MQPEPKAVNKTFEKRARPESEDKGPPSPFMVFMFSLFGYPGVGHFMVGKKQLGIAFISAFTLFTVGILYEIVVIGGPLLKLITQGIPMESSPNWARIGFWVVTTSVIWFGSGLHAYILAKKMQPATDID